MGKYGREGSGKMMEELEGWEGRRRSPT